MEFDEYQKIIKKYDLGKETRDVCAPAFMDKVLGLVGEAGEVADKFKKVIRDKEGELTDEDREGIAKELGDVLWYVATLARYMGISFEEIVEGNIEKLESRYERGVLGGHGDDR